MYLLDTNICIELFSRNPKVIARLNDASHLRMYVSAVTVAELAYGAVRSSRQAEGFRQVRRLIRRANVLPIDAKCALEYGSLKATLGAVGQLLEDNDLFIASTAICRGLILVTHDKAFSRISNLRIEDWLE